MSNQPVESTSDYLYVASFFGGASAEFDINFTEELSITLRGAETDIVALSVKGGYDDKD